MNSSQKIRHHEQDRQTHIFVHPHEIISIYQSLIVTENNLYHTISSSMQVYFDPHQKSLNKHNLELANLQELELL